MPRKPAYLGVLRGAAVVHRGPQHPLRVPEVRARIRSLPAQRPCLDLLRLVLHDRGGGAIEVHAHGRPDCYSKGSSNASPYYTMPYLRGWELCVLDVGRGKPHPGGQHKGQRQ
jgi:hypothetical protein